MSHQLNPYTVLHSYTVITLFTSLVQIVVFHYNLPLNDHLQTLDQALKTSPNKHVFFYSWKGALHEVFCFYYQNDDDA